MSDIVFSRRGRGEPVVLVHGIGHRKEAWAPIVPLLAAAHDVIAIDLPGFGASGDLPRGDRDGIETYADALEKFFADLGLQRPHVVGNSLGGAIALELAERGSVRSATALSPAGFWTRGGRVWALAMLLSIRAAVLLPASVLAQVSRFGWSRRAAMATLHTHGERLSTEAFLGDIRALRDCTAFNRVLRSGARFSSYARPTVPTTVAWGTKDRILLPSQADEARRRLPDATHVPLVDCGHVPMIDAPDTVAQVVLNQTRTA